MTEYRMHVGVAANGSRYRFTFDALTEDLLMIEWWVKGVGEFVFHHQVIDFRPDPNAKVEK